MREDGSCPTCGQVLEVRRRPRPPAAVTGPGEPGDDEPGLPVPKAPWHFKVMLLALVIYLSWRAVQGMGWLASHL